MTALVVSVAILFAAVVIVRGRRAERRQLPTWTPELADFEHRLNREEYHERNNATVDMRAALETCRAVAFRRVSEAK